MWLAKVVERGMCRPSLVHPKPIRQLRDLTRYRRSLVREQSREKQRLEKILEDARIKLDSVISYVHGVSGRQMLQAMIDGQRDPAVLAEMAHGVMRRKIPQLRQALTGHFDDHHAFLCAAMLRRIDTLAADITELEAGIEKLIGPSAAAVEKLDEITGIGVRSATGHHHRPRPRIWPWTMPPPRRSTRSLRWSTSTGTGSAPAARHASRSPPGSWISTTHAAGTAPATACHLSDYEQLMAEARRPEAA